MLFFCVALTKSCPIDIEATRSFPGMRRSHSTQTHSMLSRRQLCKFQWRVPIDTCVIRYPQICCLLPAFRASYPVFAKQKTGHAPYNCGIFTLFTMSIFCTKCPSIYSVKYIKVGTCNFGECMPTLTRGYFLKPFSVFF